MERKYNNLNETMLNSVTVPIYKFCISHTVSLYLMYSVIIYKVSMTLVTFTLAFNERF